MTKTLTLIAAAGLAMLTAAVPAHAEFGSNSDRGYGADSGSTRGGKSSPGAERGGGCCKYHALPDDQNKRVVKGSGKKSGPLVGGKQSKIPGFGGPGTGTPGDHSVDRTDRQGNRGGAFD